MANEITFAALETTGGRVSSVLSALVQSALFDATDLRSTLLAVPWESMGSDTLDVTRDATPGAFSAATNETVGGITNSAYTTAKFSLAVAPYRRKYQVSDLFGISGGPIDASMVVNNLVAGVGLTMTDLVTTLFPAVGTSVGTTGTPLSVATVYSAMGSLRTSGAQGPYYCVLHPKAMTDFIASLRSETGPMQWMPASAEIMALKGPGFQGTWSGVEFYQSDSVEKINANADYSCAMYAGGAFAYTMAPVASMQTLIPSAHIILNAGPVLVEAERDASNGLSSLVAHLYPAVVEAQASRAVELVVGV